MDANSHTEQPHDLTDHNSDASSNQKLLTFSSGGWVLLIAFILTCLSAILVLKPIFDTGFHQAIGDGQNPDTYGFDLSNLAIPRNQLIAVKPKDAVHAVPAALVETLSVAEVNLMNLHEYVPFLLPSDKVIALTIGNDSRAYPIRLLNVHEIVNDTLGGNGSGTPIAVTWSPLCGSAAVFQRPDAQTEFGVSGLLYNSDLILFDRHADPKQESLWPQLSFQPIAGPAVAPPAQQKSLTLLPFELTTWKEWSTRHPDTRVFRGLRTLSQDYSDAQDPYNLYLATDDLKFAVAPLPPFHGLPLKTPIVLTTTDMHHWKAALASTAPAVTQPGEWKVYSFLFAWYAQHPRDTDYSALRH